MHNETFEIISTIKYLHVRFDDHTPFATLAIANSRKITPSNMYDYEYRVGIAVCSKKDQFIKKRGRKIASARLFLDKAMVHQSPTIVAYKVIDELMGSKRLGKLVQTIGENWGCSRNARLDDGSEWVNLSRLARSIMYLCRLCRSDGLHNEIEEIAFGRQAVRPERSQAPFFDNLPVAHPLLRQPKKPSAREFARDVAAGRRSISD